MLVKIMAITEFTTATIDKPIKFKKKNNEKTLATWQYHNDPHSLWGKVSMDLLMSKQFQELSKAAQMLYIVLIVNKINSDQSQCLYNALKDYGELTGEPISDEELKYKCGDYKKSREYADLFVIPAKQLAQYGFKKSYASKLKQELEDNGFIETFANKKSKGRVDLAVTIYKFSDKWKHKKTKHGSL